MIIAAMILVPATAGTVAVGCFVLNCLAPDNAGTLDASDATTLPSDWVPGYDDPGDDPVPAATVVTDECAEPSFLQALAPEQTKSPNTVEAAERYGFATGPGRTLIEWVPVKYQLGQPHRIYRAVHPGPADVAKWELLAQFGPAPDATSFANTLDATDPAYAGLTDVLVKEYGPQAGYSPKNLSAPLPTDAQSLFVFLHANPELAIGRMIHAYPLAIALGAAYVDTTGTNGQKYDYAIHWRNGTSWVSDGGVDGIVAGSPTPLPVPTSLTCFNLMPGHGNSIVGARDGPTQAALENQRYDRLVLLNWSAVPSKPPAWTTGWDIHRRAEGKASIERLTDTIPFWPSGGALPVNKEASPDDSATPPALTNIPYKYLDRPEQAKRYTYWISPRDLLGQIPVDPEAETSRFSPGVMAAARDLSPPRAPRLHDPVFSDNPLTLTISWTPPNVGDDSSPGAEQGEDLAGYHAAQSPSPRARLPADCSTFSETHKCFRHYGFFPGNELVNSTPTPDEEQWYVVQAVDEAGNRGPWAGPVRAVPRDREGPTNVPEATSCPTTFETQSLTSNKAASFPLSKQNWDFAAAVNDPTSLAEVENLAKPCFFYNDELQKAGVAGLETYCRFGDQEPIPMGFFNAHNQGDDLSSLVGTSAPASASCWASAVDSGGAAGDFLGAGLYGFSIEKDPPQPIVSRLQRHTTFGAQQQDRVQVEWAAKTSQFTEGFFIIRRDLTAVEPEASASRLTHVVEMSQQTRQVPVIGRALPGATIPPPTTGTFLMHTVPLLLNWEAGPDEAKAPHDVFWVPPETRSFNDTTVQEGHLYEYRILQNQLGKLIESEPRPIKLLRPHTRPMEDLSWIRIAPGKDPVGRPKLEMAFNVDCEYCVRTKPVVPEIPFAVEHGFDLTKYTQLTQPGITLVSNSVTQDPAQLNAQPQQMMGISSLGFPRILLQTLSRAFPSPPPTNTPTPGLDVVNITTAYVTIYQSLSPETGFFQVTPVIPATVHVPPGQQLGSVSLWFPPPERLTNYVIVQVDPQTGEPVGATPPQGQGFGAGGATTLVSARFDLNRFVYPDQGPATLPTRSSCSPAPPKEDGPSFIFAGGIVVQNVEVQLGEDGIQFDGMGIVLVNTTSRNLQIPMQLSGVRADEAGNVCQGEAKSTDPFHYGGMSNVIVERLSLLPTGQLGAPAHADLLFDAPDTVHFLDTAPGFTLRFTNARWNSDATFEAKTQLPSVAGCPSSGLQIVLDTLPARLRPSGTMQLTQNGLTVERACIAEHAHLAPDPATLSTAQVATHIFTPLTIGDPRQFFAAGFSASEPVSLTEGGIQGKFVRPAGPATTWYPFRPLGLKIGIPEGATLQVEGSRIQSTQLPAATTLEAFYRAQDGLLVLDEKYAFTPFNNQAAKDGLYAKNGLYRFLIQHNGLTFGQDGRLYSPGVHPPSIVPWLYPYGFEVFDLEPWELYIPPVSLPSPPRTALQQDYGQTYKSEPNPKLADPASTLQAGLNLRRATTSLTWDNCGVNHFSIPIKSDLYLRAGGMSDAFAAHLEPDEYADTSLYGYAASIWQFDAVLSDNLIEDSGILMDFSVPWPALVSFKLDGMNVDPMGCASNAAVAGGGIDTELAFWHVGLRADGIEFRSADFIPSQSVPDDLPVGPVAPGGVAKEGLMEAGRKAASKQRASLGIDKPVNVQTTSGDDGVTMHGIAGLPPPDSATPLGVADHRVLWILGSVEVPRLNTLYDDSKWAYLGFEAAFLPDGSFHDARTMIDRQKPDVDVIPLYEFDGFPFLVHSVTLSPWRAEPSWNKGASQDLPPGKQTCGKEWNEPDILRDSWWCKGAVIIQGFPVAPALGPLGRGQSNEPASFFTHSWDKAVGMPDFLGASRTWSHSEHIHFSADFNRVVYTRAPDSTPRFVGFEAGVHVGGKEGVFLLLDTGLIMDKTEPHLFYGQAAAPAAYRAATITGDNGGVFADGNALQLPPAAATWAQGLWKDASLDFTAAEQLVAAAPPSGYAGGATGHALSSKGVQIDQVSGKAQWQKLANGVWQPNTLAGEQTLRLEPEGLKKGLMEMENTRMELLPEGKLLLTGSATADILGQPRQLDFVFHIHPESEDFEGAFSMDGNIQLGILNLQHVDGVMGVGDKIAYFGFQFDAKAGGGQSFRVAGEALIGKIDPTSTLLSQKFPVAMKYIKEGLPKATLASPDAYLAGFYLTGTGNYNVLDYGCVLKLGAEIRVSWWYWSYASGEEAHGGRYGGAVYGSVACVLTGRGDIDLVGRLGPDGKLRFDGNGYVAAGAGECDPETWNGGWHARWWGDKWCEQIGAHLTISYVQGQGWDGDYDIDSETF